MKQFRMHLELDRPLRGILCTETKWRSHCGIPRKVYVYDLTSRRQYERAMRLSDLRGTKVINSFGLGRV